MTSPARSRRGGTHSAAPATRSAGWALAVILGLVCVVAGLVSGRPDTVALAAPFALLAAAGRRSGTAPAAPAAAPVTDPVTGSAAAAATPSWAAVAVRVAGPRDRPAGGRLRLQLQPADPLRAGASSDRLVTVLLASPGCPPDAMVLRAGEDCPLLADGPPSGEADILAYGWAGSTADLMEDTAFTAAESVRVSILPRPGALPARPVSRRLRGLAGTHRSRRPGEGSDVRSIAPLRPGDPLRRIDWRATARRSSDQDRIMVRGRFADAEASVFLVIDQAHDLPDRTADWFSAAAARLAPGSLHLARSAAATVAASYLSVGDRVGLDDLSGTRRALRAAAGSRQLEQIRARLAGTEVIPRRRRRRDPAPPQGSVVLVFSPFLDAEAARLLLLWRAQGHVVAGIDCMPPLVRTETTAAQTASVRLVLLRRRLLLDGLRRDGVPVFTGGSPDADVVDGDRAVSGDRPAGLSGPELELGAGLLLLSRETARRGGAGAPRGPVDPTATPPRDGR
ncbi:DUF58 domain-containing protein [Arthrobacter agilis]|uniref:DUF58 domain-containing protein n=1 Tax=Arthrobacter agilis TaxID=37921 RepID=UPI000F6CE03C|nr:DUF58 domain-containing protein [Arthrobacter agilis]TPV23896.1 DUF58 domain-containing protein [Arthrobacter agilis]VDR32642.1 Uncharacterized conserved protein (some members contain a von Willebrand factor type A (vWA) domain) [Arthrobacter agilis]